MISSILSRILILGFGYLYPAYCSYKAIRTKNVKEYVRWMMHWVVFSGFVFFETLSDVFISWFPFYHEVKLAIVFWLLSPMTKGSSHVYRSFIHPKLTQHEQEIDEYINQAKEKGYKAVIDVGSKTFDFASKLIVETAIKGVSTIKKSYSLSDLTRSEDDVDTFRHEMLAVKHRARSKNTVATSNISTRSSSLSKTRPASEIHLDEYDRRNLGNLNQMAETSYSTTDLTRTELSRTSSNASLRSKRPLPSASSTLPRRRASEKAPKRATK